MSANTQCNSRYIGVLKTHARPGNYGTIGGATLNASNYLTSHSTVEDAQKAVEEYLCRLGYTAGTIPYKVFIIDQEENKIVAHMGIDPKPISTPWTLSKS